MIKHNNKKPLIKNIFKIVFAHINILLCLCKHEGVTMCSHTFNLSASFFHEPQKGDLVLWKYNINQIERLTNLKS